MSKIRRDENTAIYVTLLWTFCRKRRRLIMGLFQASSRQDGSGSNVVALMTVVCIKTLLLLRRGKMGVYGGLI